MMLDAKATFDELIARQAPDEESRDRVLENRIYQQISNALAGSQEYMAMEKLFELHSEGRFDLLVLDTPPTRNALDFLDAPRRLTQFIEGRSLRVFMRPTGLAARVAGRGASVMLSVFKRIVGFDLIADLAEFFNAFSGMVDGFQARAKRVNSLLADRRTCFLVVCGPQGEPIDEAVYFHRKLIEAKLPFGGVIVNKVHYPAERLRGDGAGLPAALAAEARRRGPGAAGGGELRRLPGAGRARRSQHRAARGRAAQQGSDPRPPPRRGRPRPRRPGRDQPLPVRDRRGAGGDRRRSRLAGAAAVVVVLELADLPVGASGTGKRWRTRGLSIRSRWAMSPSIAGKSRVLWSTETSSSQAVAVIRISSSPGIGSMMRVSGSM